MRNLNVFNFISIDGYYKGPSEDISWNKHDVEEEEFSVESLKPGNTLLFGRITYEMMESFWTLPMAFENFPITAERMNKAEKIVFSKTLKKADWYNTTIINQNMVDEIWKLKQMTGKDMTILGSGNIVTQLAEAGLIDDYQIMIYPVAIGNGTPLFKNINQHLDLKLTNSRIFKSGTVLLCYKPIEK